MLSIKKEPKKWFDFATTKVIPSEIVLHYYSSNWIKDVRTIWEFETCHIDFLYLFLFSVREIVLFRLRPYLWCTKYALANFEATSKMSKAGVSSNQLIITHYSSFCKLNYYERCYTFQMLSWVWDDFQPCYFFAACHYSNWITLKMLNF